jgi:hypothetical protein
MNTLEEWLEPLGRRKTEPLKKYLNGAELEVNITNKVNKYCVELNNCWECLYVVKC